MKRSRSPIRFILAGVLALIALSFGCGGGGGGGGVIVEPDFTATFTGAASGGGPGDVSMEVGASSGADFDVRVMVQGALADFFGMAFRVQLPANVVLRTGSGGAGSILLQESPDATIFGAVQVGNEILADATRVQPLSGFDNGVDVPGGKSLVMTLRFRATAATAGNLTFSNMELRTCDDPTETCPELTGLTWTGGSLVAN